MTLDPLIQQLIAHGPVLTDGAWGTQLQARGLAPGEVPDLWNLTHPEKVGAVARAYVEAGSQIILTNTFGANRLRLAEDGGADRVEEINEAGAPHFARSGEPTGAGFCLDRAERQNAHERRRDRRGIARRFRRTGAGFGARRGGRAGCGNHAGFGGSQDCHQRRRKSPVCRWSPAWCSIPARTRTAR